jgi:O-antigen/teichoic acid export membrane protein
MNLLKSEPVQFFARYITKGHERSVRAKKNIFSSLIIKGFSILTSFLMLPITLSYVDASQYGVWLTLSSIVNWFIFFDIGLTQGLRNKFAEAKARGEDDLAQIFVSTTFAILGLIFLVIWALFLVVNNFLDWSKLLNVSGSIRPEVTTLAVIVFTYFCLSFVLRIITTVLLADQRPAGSSLVNLIGQLISLAVIFVLVKTTEGSIVKLGLALCLSPLIIYIIANLFLFNGIYKKYRPSLSKVKLKYVRELFNLGVVFFVIQLAVIIQFETANIIIARNFGTAEVTSYNVVHKYFGMLNMVFAIFLTPFWSASTEAFQKSDFQWIRNGIRRYNQLNILLVIAGCVMLAFSGFVYRIWLGEGTVEIPFTLSLFGFLFFNTSMFGGKYVSFLNGISALRIQFYACLISPFLYILLVLIFIKVLHMGVYAIFIASIFANFNTFILAPIQTNKVLNKGKRGIWIK